MITEIKEDKDGEMNTGQSTWGKMGTVDLSMGVGLGKRRGVGSSGGHGSERGREVLFQRLVPLLH